MTCRNFVRAFGALAAAAVLAGCGTSYSWRSGVPPEKRTVSVPTFANETDITELGAVATRQLLREIQREGTFRIASEGEAALEVQGVIKKSSMGVTAYDRRAGIRYASFKLRAEVEISVVDKARRAVVVDAKRYVASTDVTSSQDLMTSRRDASGRLMEDLARQVVDDLLDLKFSEQEY